jgi:hypothetical protein
MKREYNAECRPERRRSPTARRSLAERTSTTRTRSRRWLGTVREGIGYIEPNPVGDDFEFANKVVGGRIRDSTFRPVRRAFGTACKKAG